MKDPRLSVIMSVYNEPIEWLKQSIDSILQQTFKDFEFIIVCDNPSYKDGIDILRSYSDKDKRIILVFNETNVGLTKSLNRGLAIARGDYIARMDADDISLTTRLKIQVEYLEHNPDVLICGSFVDMINDDGDYVRTPYIRTTYREIKSTLIFGSQLAHPTVMFRASNDGKKIIYDESFRYSQDFALWATLIRNHKIINIPKVLVNYRYSSQQISTKHSVEQNACAMRAMGIVAKELDLKIDDKGLSTIEYLSGRNKEYPCKNSYLTDEVKRIIVANKENRNIDAGCFQDMLLISYLSCSADNFGIVAAWNNIIVVYANTRIFRIKPLLILFKLSITSIFR